MPTPQQLLDQIHDTGYAALYDPALTSQERAAYLHLTKQKLRLVKQALRAKQKDIERRWDGRKKIEAQLEQQQLEPYVLIDQTLDRCEIAFIELSNALQLNQPLPEPLRIGKVFVTDERLGHHDIVADQAAAEAWQSQKDLFWQLGQLLNQQEQLKQQAKHLQGEIKKLSAKSFFSLYCAAFFVFFAFLTWVIYLNDQELLTTIFFILLSLCILAFTLISIHYDFVRKPKQLKKTTATLETLKVTYKQLTRETRQIKTRLGIDPKLIT